jgi:hypothetical protein
MLLGLIFIGGSILVLWFVSPVKTGRASVEPALVGLFVAGFALGFVLFVVGALGYQSDYPAFVSAGVLYAVLGGLYATWRYVEEGRVRAGMLAEMESASFWTGFFTRVLAWPYEILAQLEVWRLEPLTRHIGHPVVLALRALWPG